MTNVIIRSLRILTIVVSGMLTFIAPSAAQEPIRIGIVAHMSGPYAAAGQKYQQGVDAFFHAYGRTINGRPIEVIFRDLAGGDPSKAKQLAEELIVRDKVKLIGGFYLSPEALATGPSLAKGNIFAVAFNGSALGITQSSPTFVRAAGSMAQIVSTQAEFAYARGKRRAYIAVSDYSVGHDVADIFKKRFTALGGTIVGEDRMPLATVDYSAFAERMSAANPDMLELFVPNGAPAFSLSKALGARGLLRRNDLMAMGQGWIDDASLGQFDESIVGTFDAQVYAIATDGAENRKFQDALKARFSGVVPSYEAASAYDGMLILAQAIRESNGNPEDGRAIAQKLAGWKFEGARGPQTIEATTRGTAMNVYIRKVVSDDGRLRLVVEHTAREVPVVP